MAAAFDFVGRTIYAHFMRCPSRDLAENWSCIWSCCSCNVMQRAYVCVRGARLGEVGAGGVADVVK